MVRASPRSLDEAVGRFCRLLRGQGLSITLAEAVDALRALEVVDLADRGEVRLALRTVLAGRPEDLAPFDRCFDAFFRVSSGAPAPPRRVEADGPGPEADGPGPEADGEGEAVPVVVPTPVPSAGRFAGLAHPNGAPMGRLPGEPAADGDDGIPQGTHVMGDHEALAVRDFSTLAADELNELERLARRMARRLVRRVGRRRRPAGRRGVVDLRRSVRRNVTRGELVELAFRRRKPKRARLVVLCDVSGSMDRYSRMLLQFLYALQHAFDGMESFTFSTHLTRVTDHLRAGSFARALERLGALRDWSGGTRIGESLERFNREHGMRVVDRRAIVLLLSDGWDTGDPDLLARELAAIRRRAGRLVWLNPLLGQPSYEPLTRGMAAALPLVHAFMPAHNLASLRALERVLRL